MRLHLPPDLIEKLNVELKRAGSREIGGVLVGEHVGDAEFRLVDLSVQRNGGNVACFVRRPEQHADFLQEFFARTGGAFERFNYLGEWHSHPSFPATPSAVDVTQMHDVVAGGSGSPLFAVLVVVRLEGEAVQLSAHSFRSGHRPEVVDVVITDRPDGDPPPQPVGWLQRLFAPQPRPRRRYRLI